MRIRFLIPVLVGLTVFCSKEKRDTEGRIVPGEGESVRVEMPEVSWKTTVAVLPFAPEDGSMALFFQDQIASGLSRSPSLKVLRPGSLRLLKDRFVKADFVVSGTLARTGNQCILNVRMASQNTDSTILEKNIRQSVERCFTASESIAADLASALGDTLPPDPTIAPSPSARLLDAHFAALDLVKSPVREDVHRAVGTFKEILREDSTFVPAWLGLVRSYQNLVEIQKDRRLVWLTLAKESCRKALRRDSLDAEAHALLGKNLLLFGDFRQADRSFRRAIALESGRSDAWSGLGVVLGRYGLYEQALEAYSRAADLDPTDLQASTGRAMILIGLGRSPSAEEEIRRALLFHPGVHELHTFLGLARFYQGDFGQASDEITQGIQSENLQALAYAVRAMIDAKMGLLDEALANVELEVKPRVGNDGSLAVAVAAVYTLLGRKGEAIPWLEKAVAWGYRDYPWLVQDKNFQGLWEDPRTVPVMDRLKAEWEQNRRTYVEERTNLSTQQPE